MGATTGDDSKELLEAQAHIWNHTFNYITSMSLRCAVQLGIPDIISNHDGPVTLSELVESLSVSPIKSPHLYRLMRMLVHCGFFALQNNHEDEEGYVLTPSSKLLLKNHQIDLSPLVQYATDPFVVTSFHFMSGWFLGTESSPFEASQGMNVWDYCSTHSDANMILNAGLASDSEHAVNVLVKDYRAMFEGFGSLVDVGGGTGTVAKAISEAFPLMRCTVLDLPHVVSNLRGTKNLVFVSGDMFKFIPSADIVLLKFLLHDWSDEECVEILKKCKDAILSKDNGGKVVIMEIVIDEKKGNYESTEIQLCIDITMMALVTGKERTEDEWEKLFKEAGFTSYKMTPFLGFRSIIEVFP